MLSLILLVLRSALKEWMEEYNFLQATINEKNREIAGLKLGILTKEK